jgi:hypothetical protein
MQLGEAQQCLYCRLFCLLSFWLTRSSQLPRPASPASTSKVETVHPQDFLGINLKFGWKAFFPLFSFVQAHLFYAFPARMSRWRRIQGKPPILTDLTHGLLPSLSSYRFLQRLGNNGKKCPFLAKSLISCLLGFSQFFNEEQ